MEKKQDEVVSGKMMQSLERCMRSYPDVWAESSRQHLLEEVVDGENSRAEERLHTVMTRMLFPMALILEAEHAAMKEERQRMLDATLALQRVQQECHHALLDMSNQHTTSARDMEELGKALEANRQAAEEASKKLAEKNAHIHLMMQSHRDLLVRLVCGGPSEFVNWATQEIHSQSMPHLTTELERSWWPFTHQVPDPADCSITISPKKTEDEEENITCHQDANCEKTSFPGASLVSFPGSSLACLVVTETLRQVEESYRSVRGPFSVPSAMAGFWMGLAGRMTCLAIVTLFPQVMQKISSDEV